MNIFKRFNQYLISNHPVIWNMKVAYILPAAIIINIILYAIGYAQNLQLSDLKNEDYVSNGVMWSFSVLISILLVIIWLTFYLRNSAVKNLYPVSKSKTAMEFLILIVIFFSIISFGMSWSAGKHHKYAKISEGINLTETINKYNIAQHFLAFYPDAFMEKNSCTEGNFNDTTHLEFLDTPIDEVQSQFYYFKDDTTSYPKEDTVKAKPQKTSYLYYCGMTFRYKNSPGITDRFEFNKKANELLTSGNKDGVKKILRDYLELCDKYKLKYYLPVDQYVEDIFSTPDFDIVRVEVLYGYNLDHIKSNKSYYVERDLSNIINGIRNYREPFLDWDKFIVLAHVALALSFFLMTFRLSRLKEWFFSLIGAGVVMVIISVISVITQEIYPIMYTFWVIFAVHAITSIFQRKRKKLSGFTFNWFVWFLPFFIPSLLGYIPEFYRKDAPIDALYAAQIDSLYINPGYEFVEKYGFTIIQLNLIAIILYMIFIVIPLAYKWQANPEE